MTCSQMFCPWHIHLRKIKYQLISKWNMYTFYELSLPINYYFCIWYSATNVYRYLGSINNNGHISKAKNPRKGIPFHKYMKICHPKKKANRLFFLTVLSLSISPSFLLCFGQKECKSVYMSGPEFFPHTSSSPNSIPGFQFSPCSQRILPPFTRSHLYASSCFAPKFWSCFWIFHLSHIHLCPIMQNHFHKQYPS